ncbi:hypothetical protein [Geoalkalibacter halelectricus]|uniref:hypothetical protein n=1 Tax=Geoalkalibacter halelectricus TaxID=2847045 RepID=UPI00266FD81E|nr:hypothetical protein [Geoalkalibacter halelectricus]MDO3379513.1 hypothetical protein [Geoalkalibacter halelectricus]
MGCCSNNASGAGPFAEGRELVEFVAQAHGGSLRNRPIPGGGLNATCQGCGSDFLLATFVGQCPACDGVHAVSPPRCADAANIQFAGAGYRL